MSVSSSRDQLYQESCHANIGTLMREDCKKKKELSAKERQKGKLENSEGKRLVIAWVWPSSCLIG